jgi:hypothetical protein
MTQLCIAGRQQWRIRTATARCQTAVAARPRLKPTQEMEDLLHGLNRCGSSLRATVSTRCDLLSASRSQDTNFHLAHARARAGKETASSPAYPSSCRWSPDWAAAAGVLHSFPMTSQSCCCCHGFLGLWMRPWSPPLVGVVADRRCSCLPAGAAPLHVLISASATMCLRG